MEDTIKDADLQSNENIEDLEAIEIDSPNEEQSNTQDQIKEDPSDRLTPDHPRFKDVLQRAKSAEDRVQNLELELAQVKESISTRREETGDDDLTPDERASLNKIQRELDKAGYVKESNLRVQRNADTLNKLGDKYNGKNGLPAFDSTEVVAYARKKGFGDNYESAYKDMHFDALVEYEATARTKAPQAPVIERPTGGGETPGKKRITTKDIANMSDAEYEEYRSSILTAIKPQKSS